jgi:hypothetical protein
MLESGKMEAIQAFLLMGNYLQKRDRTNTGYNFIGLACRMAYGLGLHRELQTEESTIDQEKRRRLFWTMYCFESGFNITTGRPPTLIDGFIDTRIPQNIDDKVRLREPSLLLIADINQRNPPLPMSIIPRRTLRLSHKQSWYRRPSWFIENTSWPEQPAARWNTVRLKPWRGT